MVNQMVDM
jgi:hypothetical protein